MTQKCMCTRGMSSISPPAELNNQGVQEGEVDNPQFAEIGKYYCTPLLKNRKRSKQCETCPSIRLRKEDRHKVSEEVLLLVAVTSGKGKSAHSN